jgi:hypothetical protein
MDVIGNPQIADLAERTQFVVSMGYLSRAQFRATISVAASKSSEVNG